MRKIFLALVICGGLLTVSCEDNTNANTKYECPMKCEGDKTYTEEGSCPVCHMDLAEKK